MPKLKPGDQAPDLELTTFEGNDVRLSDLWTQGLTALTFYRGDFCPACNRYLHSLQARADEFRDVGLQVVAISADRSDLATATVRRNGLSFPVLSDPERRAVDAYDVFYNEQGGHAQPAVFVISREGAVLYAAVTSGPLGRPSPDDLLMIARGMNRDRAAA